MDHSPTDAPPGDVRAVLDRLIRERGLDYQRLSRAIGRNPAYIQQFIKRGSPRRLSEDDRAEIARQLGVPESMLGARVVPSLALPPPRGRAVPRRMGLVHVPVLAIGASAGTGALVDGEDVAGALAFDARWLRQLGADPRTLTIIRVTGDSMAPTLRDGDDILVDGQDTATRLRDGIYVLRIDGALMVKRVGRTPVAGVISVTSDNAAYPSWPDMAADAVHLVGRLIWTGRRIS